MWGGLGKRLIEKIFKVDVNNMIGVSVFVGLGVRSWMLDEWEKMDSLRI